MRRRCKLLYLLSWLILCCALPAAAQRESGDTVLSDTTLFGEENNDAAPEAEEDTEPARTVVYNTATPDAAQWEQATTGNDAYGYRDKREYIRKEEPPETIPWWYKLLERLVNFFFSPAGKLLLWVLLILIVGYVAYRVIAGQGGRLFGRRDRKAAAPQADGSISEHGLLEHDWEESLRAALAAGDKRLAIRYSYMRLLQALQERSLIVYRPDKTNTAYYRELTESMRQPFRTVSRQYEYAWYGNFLPEQAAMESYLQTYEGLKKSITYA